MSLDVKIDKMFQHTGSYLTLLLLFFLECQMAEAMEKVKDGMKVAVAARLCRVPRRTLDDRIKGRVCHGTCPGPSTAFGNVRSLHGR